MLITKEFLDNNTTPAGGYNRKQIEALLITYPPIKGWKKRLIGTRLPDEQALLFENAANVPEGNQLARLMSMITALPKHQREAIKEWLNAR